MNANGEAIRAAFEEASAYFLATATRVRPEQWTAPALREWSVRDLVGHTGRAWLTVETYLGRPAATIEVWSPADYVVAVLAAHGDPAAVAARGREAGSALGAAPLPTLQATAARVLALVAASEADQPIATPAGGMRLLDYLPTRTFELVVHTLDLAAAIGVAEEPPPTAGRLALQLAGEIALRTNRAAPVLRALTGRQALPRGFSVT